MANYPYTQEKSLPDGIKTTTKVSLKSGMLEAEVLFSNAGGPIVSFNFPSRFPLIYKSDVLKLEIINMTLTAPSGKNPGSVMFSGQLNFYNINLEIASWS